MNRQHLLEIEIFCNIINVTYNQCKCNAPLLCITKCFCYLLQTFFHSLVDHNSTACHLYVLFHVPEKHNVMHLSCHLWTAFIYKLKYKSPNNLEMIRSGVKLSTSVIITPKTFLSWRLRITPNSLTLKNDLERERINISDQLWLWPMMFLWNYILTCISTTLWESLVISSEFV